MLNKTQTIVAIQEINRSVSRDWLDVFDVSALRYYLDHLQQTIQPRGAESFWIRRGETPAVVTRRPTF